MRKKVYYNDPKKLDEMNSVEGHEEVVIFQHDLDQFMKTLTDRERCTITMLKNCSDYMTRKQIAAKIGVLLWAFELKYWNIAEFLID